ncbi:pantoate--beta-alanine ligase [Psychrosphaera ytuae]|uniref:Pantothenate synthetase n=2 Tax=Psychrosphaera ytuae TaxID=2820710 RepID=A0A975D8Q3_9GAMM|nr:pantoate--beta-alanine ligase [Psychrosphaera ytuae]QTH62615.1 pantoate--beta-alanine ligase [Psychrosphaera ytuae]
MKIIESLAELRAWRKECHRQGQTVAFVPTMGNLHEGHIELVHNAHKHADLVITSIFVNPMQFGENEDLDAYPRTFEADCEKLTAANNHVVFYPSVAEMYPNGLKAQTLVSVPNSTAEHCAEATQRPGHFDGVATVVTKLFNMVQPDVALFGQKDYQQVRLVQALVRDLNMPIEIIPVPTVREESGLAKSSRNGYLTAQQKSIAPALFQALSLIKEQLEGGNFNTESLIESGLEFIEQAGLKPDYIEIRDTSHFEVIDENSKEAVILVAAFLGKARLIDNLTVQL